MDINLIRSYIRNTQNDWRYITPLDFYNKYHLSKDKDYLLIDLRKPADYQKFHIDGSINIFWLNIFDDINLQKLSRDKKIFLICYVGHTSSQVMTLLQLLGYNVTSIKYGYGVSPVNNVPVAGWLDYKFPTVSSVVPSNKQSGGMKSKSKKVTKTKKSKKTTKTTKTTKTKKSKKPKKQ